MRIVFFQYFLFVLLTFGYLEHLEHALVFMYDIISAEPTGKAHS